MLFDNNDMNLDYNFLNLAGITNKEMNNYLNNNSTLNLFSSKEGFLRGNMFRNEYKPYKNLTYINITPNNDREAKMYNVMQYAFAINDLNLYLDLHANDKEALNILEKLIHEYNNYLADYENTYGPLEVCSTKGDEFDWVKGPWSWEESKGDLYV